MASAFGKGIVVRMFSVQVKRKCNPAFSTSFSLKSVVTRVIVFICQCVMQSVLVIKALAIPAFVLLDWTKI